MPRRKQYKEMPRGTPISDLAGKNGCCPLCNKVACGHCWKCGANIEKEEHHPKCPYQCHDCPACLGTRRNSVGGPCHACIVNGRIVANHINSPGVPTEADVGPGKPPPHYAIRAEARRVAAQPKPYDEAENRSKIAAILSSRE